MSLQILMQFLTSAENDPRMSAVHICLYVTLFHHWCTGTVQGPLSFSRHHIMNAAKISSRATYHRCMKDLHDFGYIRYIPSHHPVLGSMAFLNETTHQITGSLKGT